MTEHCLPVCVGCVCGSPVVVLFVVCVVYTPHRRRDPPRMVIALPLFFLFFSMAPSLIFELFVTLFYPLLSGLYSLFGILFFFNLCRGDISLARCHWIFHLPLFLLCLFFLSFLQNGLIQDENFRYIIRVLNTNLDGKRKIPYALTAIKGIGRRLAIIACKKAGIEVNRRYFLSWSFSVFWFSSCMDLVGLGTGKCVDYNMNLLCFHLVLYT